MPKKDCKLQNTNPGLNPRFWTNRPKRKTVLLSLAPKSPLAGNSLVF